MTNKSISEAPGFIVSVNAGMDANSSSVAVSGSVVHPITDAEQTLFGIQPDALKQVFSAYYGNCQQPDSVYLVSPTDTNWGDLYSDYPPPKTSPVSVTVAAVGATIQSITSNPTILNSQVFKNNSTVSGTFSCGTTQEVSTTAETNWSDSTSLEVSQTISYDISFLGSGAGGENSISFTQSFSEGGSQSETETFGVNQNVEVPLAPGQSVTVELTAGAGTMVILVNYAISIAGGDTWAVYNSPYQMPNYPQWGAHYLWYADILEAMGNSGLQTQQQITQTLTIGYYTNASIVIKDSAGNVLKQVPLRNPQFADPVMLSRDSTTQLLPEQVEQVSQTA